MSESIRIDGLPELIRKLDPQLVAGPISRFARKSGYAVMGRAQLNARPHIFDGTVNNGFVVDVQGAPIPHTVVIANTVEHAVYLEKGTRPHFPPVQAITPWALANNWEPYALAVHISRVGTKAHPFLEPALEQSRPAIQGFLATAAREIEQEAAA